MRRKTLFALALVAALALGAVAYANSFVRACSVTGGSAQQLSAVMATCGYAGTNQLQELTVVNPDAAANDLYVGQSDVSAANGLKLAPGVSITFRAASQQDVVDAGRLYLFVSSTQNAHLSARSK